MKSPSLNIRGSILFFFIFVATSCEKEEIDNSRLRIHSRTNVYHATDHSISYDGGSVYYYYDSQNRLIGTGSALEISSDYYYYPDSIYYESGYSTYSKFNLNESGNPVKGTNFSAGYDVFYLDTVYYTYSGERLQTELSNGLLDYGAEYQADSIYDEVTYYFYDAVGNVSMDSTIHIPTGAFASKHIYTYIDERDNGCINQLSDRVYLPMIRQKSRDLLETMTSVYVLGGELITVITSFHYEFYSYGYPSSQIRRVSFQDGSWDETFYTFSWENEP